MIRPSVDEIAWALAEAMQATLTSIHSIWHGYGHRVFWNQATVGLNELYDWDINHSRTVAPITPRGLWRMTRKNWQPIVEEIRGIYAKDPHLTDMLLDFDAIDEMKKRNRKAA